MLQHDITHSKYYWYGAEISEARYAEIRGILDQMPIAPEGTFYVLTEALEWELREPPDDGEADDSELVEMLEAVL